MGMFYIDTRSGDFATHEQLREHDLLDRDTRPVPPWHRIQATSDASTLWYSLMRKHTRGIWLGAVVMRSSDHRQKLLGEGWEEFPADHVGASLGAAPEQLAPTPFDVEGWERMNHRIGGGGQG
jgi:hypothetical protein